jgi:predicted metal-dependent phosphoesterase TrpH
MPTTFEADLHIHTNYSSDGQAEPKEVVLAAEQVGLFAIAVVDHNNVTGAMETVKAARGRDLLVIPGIEVTSRNGHILALGVTEPLPSGLSADETIRHIHDRGGLAVASHPGRLYTGLSEYDVQECHFSAVEVANAHSSIRQNEHALELAKRLDLGMTGGSDAHWTEEIGLCRTVFPTAPADVDGVLEAVRRRETHAVGEGRTAGELAKLQTQMLMRWLRRGGRKL